MKKLLAMLAIATLSASFAYADDKGTEFKFGGEIRERYTLDQNPNFAASAAGGENNWLQRNQFHINAVSGDKLQAYFNLLHYAVWGATGSVGTNGGAYTGAAGVPAGGALGSTQTNNLQVGEAWMWWKVSDQFSLRAGRQAVDYGDGLVFSKNDWLANPYNMEGIMGRFAWDFMDLDVGGGKFGDVGMTATAPGAFSLPPGTDTEVVFYGLYGSFKNLPDFLKKAELFAFQVNGDSGTATAAGTGPFFPGLTVGGGAWNFTNVGVHFKGDMTMVDYRLDGVYQTGKQKATAVMTQGDVSYTGSMYDLEVGLNFPEFMKGRLYAAYHMDSGNDSQNPTATATSNKGYQPLFYDQHKWAGAMDVFGFSNLTDIRAGFTINPTEDCMYGLELNMLSRTTANDVTYLQTAGNGNMFALSNPNGVAGSTAVNAASKTLGTEVDVWAKHNYGHGFNILAEVSYLTLGSYFTTTGGTAPGAAYQLVAQGQYNF